jgi:SAM-dependent methyltransferase
VKDEEKERVLRTYDERLAQYGHDPRTLGWPKRRHRLRWTILVSQWDVRGRSILDFGCGFGDMYAWCRDKKLDVDYEGIDINPKLIAEGKRKYPDAKLSVRDALVEDLERTYDYAFSSGVHNIKLEDNDAFTRETFELFDRATTRGFAVNFLSDKVEYRLDHAHHSSPERVLELAYRLSNRNGLRNDYMPLEFTVFVDKRKAFDKELAVYPEFLGEVEPAP